MDAQYIFVDIEVGNWGSSPVANVELNLEKENGCFEALDVSLEYDSERFKDRDYIECLKLVANSLLKEIEDHEIVMADGGVLGV